LAEVTDAHNQSSIEFKLNVIHKVSIHSRIKSFYMQT